MRVAQDELSGPTSAEIRRLGQFLKFNIPVNFLIAAAMVGCWLAFGFWSLLWIALMVLVNIAALFWSRA